MEGKEVMKVVGIELHTPTARELAGVATTTLFISMFATALMYFNLMTLNNALAGVLGGFGGSLASAYGISIRKHGIRGLMLTVLFCITIMMLGLISALYSDVI